MCSLAGVMAGVQLGAAVAGGMAQNKAAKAAAKQAEMEGRYAQQVAISEAEQQRYANQREMGSIRAAFGARGIAGDSASLVDVIAEAAGNLDYAALVKEHEIQMAGYSARVKAKQLRDQGRNAMYSSILGGVVDFATDGIGTNWWTVKRTPSTPPAPPGYY